MRQMTMLAAASVMAFQALGQAEKPVDSRITDVTVFLNRAQISREIKTQVEAGKVNLVLTGLTSQLDEQSIQVAGKGAFTILGIGHRQNYLDELNLPKPVRQLKDSAEALRNQLLLQQSAKEILAKEEQMLLSNQKIGGTDHNLTVAELKSMADFYRARLGDIVATRLKHDEKIKKLNERLQKVQQQLDEQNALYARNTSEIVVSIAAPAATTVDLDVRYLVANAGWIPVYDLRASDTRNPVQLSYKANVFQGTGEDWRNVSLKLSTANPSLGGVKPELSPWYLNFYEYVQRHLEGRAAGVMKSKKTDDRAEYEEMLAEAPAPASTVADFVSTVQTTLNTEFVISMPYTVQSSNKPTLVDIRQHELKADYLYSVTPKLDNDAFLMARITGWEEYSLLPGEANVFFEGTFVAKSFIDPANIRDTLAVSLGRDKRIVVKRDKVKDFTSRRTFGSSQRDSYAYEISVRNTKAEAVRITVEDQLPISQNSQIEVSAQDTGGAQYNATTGKLEWELTLQPNETRKVTYKFEVKYPKGKTVDGLY